MDELYVGREATLTSDHIDRMIESIPGAPKENLVAMARNLHFELQPIGGEAPSATYPEGVTVYNKSIPIHNTDIRLTREDAQRLLDAINAAR